MIEMNELSRICRKRVHSYGGIVTIQAVYGCADSTGTANGCAYSGPAAVRAILHAPYRGIDAARPHGPVRELGRYPDRTQTGNSTGRRRRALCARSADPS